MCSLQRWQGWREGAGRAGSPPTCRQQQPRLLGSACALPPCMCSRPVRLAQQQQQRLLPLPLPPAVTLPLHCLPPRRPCWLCWACQAACRPGLPWAGLPAPPSCSLCMPAPPQLPRQLLLRCGCRTPRQPCGQRRAACWGRQQQPCTRCARGGRQGGRLRRQLPWGSSWLPALRRCWAAWLWLWRGW